MDAIRSPGQTITIAGDVTSKAAQLPQGTLFDVTNLGNAVAFVRAGAGNVAATINDYPIPPNSSRLLRFQSGASHIATILSTGTGNVYISAVQVSN